MNRDLFVLVTVVERNEYGQRTYYPPPGSNAACKRLVRAGLLSPSMDGYLPTLEGDILTARLADQVKNFDKKESAA